MIESERPLWARGMIALVIAPVVITGLVYAAVPWIDPAITRDARVSKALGIGFGTAVFFHGIFLIGLLRGQLAEAPRADGIWIWLHVASMPPIGIGAALYGWFGPQNALGEVGAFLFFGGFGIRLASTGVRAIRRILRRGG